MVSGVKTLSQKSRKGKTRFQQRRFFGKVMIREIDTGWFSPSLCGHDPLVVSRYLKIARLPVSQVL
jgi:hypothetical protein